MPMVELADEIHARQPNLLASVLVLHRYGVDMLQLEVPIYILLVAFQAMNHCGGAPRVRIVVASIKS